jgi:hypothetical protein
MWVATFIWGGRTMHVQDDYRCSCGTRESLFLILNAEWNRQWEGGICNAYNKDIESVICLVLNNEFIWPHDQDQSYFLMSSIHLSHVTTDTYWNHLPRLWPKSRQCSSPAVSLAQQKEHNTWTRTQGARNARLESLLIVQFTTSEPSNVHLHLSVCLSEFTTKKPQL